MKLSTLTILTVLITGVTASAQSPWRFSAGYAPLVGLKTKFSGFGNFNGPAIPLPAPGPGQNYYYLDGAVLVDSSGGGLGSTTNFSYQNDSQYDGGAGVINFTTIAGGSVSNAGSVEERGAAAGSFDFSAFLDLGQVSFIPSAVAGRSATWGLRMGGQYSRVESDNRDTLGVGVGIITDSFSTLGGVPPLAPYPGSFAGPGFELAESPATRPIGAGTAIISGSRELDVHFFSAQFGTYLEIPIAKKLDVTLESGVILALATGSYRYDTTMAAGGAVQSSNGYDRTTRLLPGFYAGVGLLYHVTENIGIQGGVRYQFLKEFQIDANGSNAAVSFATAFSLNLGVVYKF